MKTQEQIEADIIGLDRNSIPVLLVEVKANAIVNMVSLYRIITFLSDARAPIPFAMFANLREIVVFRWEDGRLSDPILRQSTPRVLEHYDPEFSSKEIYERYLIRLVEAWLRDLAYHWKSESPPGVEELLGIGLSQRLADGTTISGGSLP